MFLYVMKKHMLNRIGATEDMLIIHPFDAHGKEHGQQAWSWALNIPGAIDNTQVTNLRGAAQLQGTSSYYYAKPCSDTSQMVLLL